jgi:DNA-directed RNA polymerase specialized sigma24 family protein
MSQTEPNTFEQLIARIRAGDDAAAVEFMRDFEGYVRRMVRVKMADPRLRRRVSDSDVCQSVLASFFVRARLGQFNLDSPDAVRRLLATMARNKVANHDAHNKAQRRDVRKQQAMTSVMPGREDSPSIQVALGELVARAQGLLTEEERQLIALRQDGVDWNEIAARLDGNAEALRKRFTRAMDRVLGQLGLD